MAKRKPKGTDPTGTSTSTSPRAKRQKYEPTDEFQQVSKPDFVDAFRVKGLGYGGDVFYQPQVGGPRQIAYTSSCQFIDPDTAVKWYNDLLDLDTCASPLPRSY